MRTIFALMLLACGAVAAPAEEVHVRAKDLAAKSANISAEYPQFDNLTLCVGAGGWMEWKVQLAGGKYFVHFFHCSGQPRPCLLSINGRTEPGNVLGEPTGGFFRQHLRWQTYGPFSFDKGPNAIRLTAAGYMPHLKELTVSTDSRPPQTHVFRDAAAERQERLKQLNLDGLRAAIVYLAKSFPDRYTQADEYLAQLDAIHESVVQNPLDRSAADLANRLRRDALVRANPLIDFDKLLFIRRYTYSSSHYYTDYIDGCRNFGGNLCVLSLDDGSVAELAPQLEGGIFGRFDLSFDGRRVVFDYKAAPGQGFRIWEAGIDGTGLRQVTFPPPDEAQRIDTYWQRDSAFLKGRNADYRHHTDDMHPCYLPDGGIAFISSRCERGILCDGPDVLTTTALYRMDADGRNIEVLSQTPVSEASPSMTNDGRILYTRWEYVDKADVVIKCLWAMRPDGTGSVEVFGNDITFPDTMLHGRAIPARNNLFVVIGAPHMPLGVGTVIRLDVNRPIRTRQPMTYITPDLDIRAEHGYFHRRDGQWIRDNRGPLYTDAWPLSENFFLVSCNPDREYNDLNAYGLYLLDEFGNRVLIHRDQEMSCWQPVPLRPRPRPPILPRSRAAEPEPATLVLRDVYQALSGVPRGTIKYLRVMETEARPWSARHRWDGDSRYQQHAVVSMNTHLHVKRLHGIVPVEEDGSAAFRVPADKNLFFQALDADFMEVQRMRTFVNLRPGETRSCIGCHEMRQWAPSNARPMLAMEHPPRRLGPQPGETAPRPLYYPTDVQPILDKHCVRCHGPERQDGDLDLSGTMTELFCRSYENILNRDLVKVWRENDPKTGDASPIPPYTLGSHASRLIQLVRRRHEGAELSREEFITLVTWVDANAPYYGSYYGRRNLKYRDHTDYRPVPH